MKKTKKLALGGLSSDSNIGSELSKRIGSSAAGMLGLQQKLNPGLARKLNVSTDTNVRDTGLNKPKISPNLPMNPGLIEPGFGGPMSPAKQGPYLGTPVTTASGPAPAPNAAMMKKGGKVSSASKRADGIAQRGKTRGRII